MNDLTSIAFAIMTPDETLQMEPTLLLGAECQHQDSPLEVTSTAPDTTITTTSNNSVNNNDDATNNQMSNNNNGKRKKKSKANIKQRKQNHTWRPEDDHNGNDGGHGSNTEPTAGSFACPAMREQFGVVIPPHLLPPLATTATATTTDDDDNTMKNKREPRTKRKLALLLGYVGSDYAGFQINPQQNTLQAAFEVALLKSGLISPLNFGFPHKYGWSTSGRTDRGVHACAQVCSAKLEFLPGQDESKARDLLNQHLPEHFRVLDVVKTSKAFHAKTGRSRVRYQYMIPSFCFFPREQLRDVLLQTAPPPFALGDNHDSNTTQPQEPVVLTTKQVQDIQAQLHPYRISVEQKDALQNALQAYCGTHSFHNFTKGLKASEQRAKRFIVSFQVEDPVVLEGVEWIPTQVTGQSFLLHQIRKMISLAVECVQKSLSTEIISKALQKDVVVPTGLAPAQGLFLEMSFYDAYNHRKQILDELNWTKEGTDACRRWKAFRKDVIMKHVMQEEQDEGHFVRFLYRQAFGSGQQDNQPKDDLGSANVEEVDTVSNK